MLILAIENFVFFSTLLGLMSFAVCWAVHRLSRRGVWTARPHVMARVYTATLLVPPLAALWLVAAALLPEWWLGKAAFDAAHSTPIHELHLLSELTTALEPALAYATFAFALAAVSFAIWSSLRGYLKVGDVIARLEMNAPPPQRKQLDLVERLTAKYRLDVGLVMSDYPLTFVWGFRRSKLVLSSGLLNTLTLEELTGVLEHEAAHHARRDNLFKLALTLCAYASMAFPLSRLILKWREEEVEMICDEIAVARTATPLDVASALVKLRRRTVTPTPRVSTTSLVSSSFTPDDMPSFERRVHRLIAFADEMPDPAHAAHLSQPSRLGTLVVTTFVMGTLVALSLLAPLAVHRGAETLIQIIN